MKIPVYIKIAKTKKGFKVQASEKPSMMPIKSVTGYKADVYYPTVFIGVEIEVPAESFNQAAKIIAKIDYRVEEVAQVEEVVQEDIKVSIQKGALKNLRK